MQHTGQCLDLRLLRVLTFGGLDLGEVGNDALQCEGLAEQTHLFLSGDQFLGYCSGVTLFEPHLLDLVILESGCGRYRSQNHLVSHTQFDGIEVWVQLSLGQIDDVPEVGRFQSFEEIC